MESHWVGQFVNVKQYFSEINVLCVLQAIDHKTPVMALTV